MERWRRLCLHGPKQTIEAVRFLIMQILLLLSECAIEKEIMLSEEVSQLAIQMHSYTASEANFLLLFDFNCSSNRIH